MKIAITSEGQSLEAAIDPRFGRCKYFLIMDTDTGKFEAVENSHAQNSGGAGIQAGQLVVSKGVEAVLTGNMGPNAFQVVQSAGVKVITGVSGKISEVLERYKSGKLEAAKSPSVSSKSGISKT
jgi:predicted Fe-Mo cluster-binding NifX family protein